MALHGATSLDTTISEAIEDARIQGLGERHQHQYAVKAVMGLDLGLTTKAAARLVNTVMELRE